MDPDSLGWWLCERQTRFGGFNGRPEKAPDVCYSWWILSTLDTIDRIGSASDVSDRGRGRGWVSV